MSKFLVDGYQSLEPYVPGEQPQGQKFIKLNTNESPYPASERVVNRAREILRDARLYPDPDYVALREALAVVNEVRPSQIVVGNGSDEILNLAFMAFCDKEIPAVYPEISYGFYPVFAQGNQVASIEIPLCDDFTIDPQDYCFPEKRATIVIANPNAPTGIALSVDQVAHIAAANPNNVVVVDEAYVAFGGQTCLPLLDEYPNVMIVRTFSKSHSLAGCRLGYGIANEELIGDLNTLRNSINPYNVSNGTCAYGIAVLENNDEFIANCAAIVQTREQTRKSLETLGFDVLSSATNFLFARCPSVDGETIYRKLRERGILVRHFNKEKIADFNRITIGTPDEMRTLVEALSAIVNE